MAFNINAHIILQGPKNIKAVTAGIQKQLGGLIAPVTLKINASAVKNASSLQKVIKSLNTDMRQLAGHADHVNKSFTNLSIVY